MRASRVDLACRLLSGRFARFVPGGLFRYYGCNGMSAALLMLLAWHWIGKQGIEPLRQRTFAEPSFFKCATFFVLSLIFDGVFVVLETEASASRTEQHFAAD